MARSLGNYFTEIENADNNLILEITANKKKLVSNRTSIGASSEYTVTIIFNVKVTSGYNPTQDEWKEAINSLIQTEELIWHDTDKKGRPRNKSKTQRIEQVIALLLGARIK